MRTLSAKALLATMNLSPLLEAVAILAERLVLKNDESGLSEIDGADHLGVPKRRGQMTLRLNEDTTLP